MSANEPLERAKLAVPTTEAGRALWTEVTDSIAAGGGLHVTAEDVIAIEQEAVAAGYVKGYQSAVSDRQAEADDCREAVAAALDAVEREVEGCRGGSPDRNDTVDDVLAIIREVRD